MVKLVIDAGHGLPDDPGATSGGLKEAQLTLDIAKRIQSKLKPYKQISVKMTRTTDKFLTLTQRANIANSWGADAFISVHINSGGGTGFESYVYNGGISAKTKQLQSDVHTEIMKRIDVRDRGKKSANFAVVRQTTMPAILTENLFIDGDNSELKKDNVIEELAQGHVDGILKYFGIKSGSKPSNSKPAKPSKPAKKPSKPTNKANLTVDGKWGKSSTRALQKALGTPKDGFISKQPRNPVTQSLYGGTVQFGSGGSNVIVALQKKVGAGVDGKLGPGTVRALQKYLGTTVDGVLSRPSMVVEEMQRRLNNGTF